MKANEFVKKFGSKSAKYWIDHFNNVNTLPDEFINTEFLGDLKRLVESHELVEKHGGLENAKDEYFSCVQNNEPASYVAKAIFDVESCQ